MLLLMETGLAEPGQRGSLLGRARECADLDGLLEAIRASRSRSLVLRGEPGIGKTALLEYLSVSAPQTALLGVTPDFLRANPEVHLTLGTRRVEVAPGWHFGSRYPGDPSRIAVYDFLPDALLTGVANLEDFRAILVFDKWVGNADGRQAVFHRAMVRSGAGGHQAFVARMIDHGYAFNGPNWDFPESPLQGLYARKLVYQAVRRLDDFQPWLDLVMSFPEEVVDHAWKSIPPEWIEDDEAALEELLDRLFKRRKRLPDLISVCRGGRVDPFPNWT